MAISCDTSSLAQGAACFDKCVPPGMQASLQTYLLAVIAGGSLDPNTLMQAAASAGFDKKIPPGMEFAVQTYLLCQILNK